jgi:hypothetical protein
VKLLIFDRLDLSGSVPNWPLVSDRQRVARTRGKVPMFLAVLLSMANVVPAFAVLGESAATVEQDRAMLNGQRQSAPEASYSVEIIESPGMVIREYVSPEGVVFAVAWRQHNGVQNLEHLLGAYYAEYSQTVSKQPRRSHRFLHVETEQAVVETGGRMGAVWGRAWVGSLLPTGLSPGDIK